MEQKLACEDCTREQLLSRLDEIGLVPPADIYRIAQANPLADGAELARAFCDAEFLTPFQFEVIRAGKQSDLKIGNYDVLDRLGAGGMGTVFKARHRRMKRIVALKVLSAHLSKDTTFVQRFQREVETIARFHHANIVMAFDADEAEIGHFLVMELVNGQDLSSLVFKEGPMDVAGAVQCILHAARGLEYAHAQGIIHRDIKPANLLRDESGVVKVTDLGLARFAQGAADTTATSAEGITQAGGILGTADYMPPEQAVDSSSIDHRADIYSLGATLYFLLTGKAPYKGASLMATLLLHRDAPIPSLRVARLDVPAALDDVYCRMLAKVPEDRPQSLKEVIAALEAILPGADATPRAAPTAPAGPAVPAATIVSPDASALSRSETVAERPPLSALVVLLVEPSRTQAAIIRKYLQALGDPTIVTVANGHEALKAIQTQTPDVILSAMHLSDMTGVQLARQVRAEKFAIAPGFVLISSESEGQDAAEMSLVAQTVVLHKPFTAEALSDALKLASRRIHSTPTRASPSRASDIRVLIVDDSAAARLNALKVLTSLGLSQFTEAMDGAQAVAVLACSSFDLIVTDYNMPLMDGCAFIQYLKQNPATATLPIIMVTTETAADKLNPIRKLGVDAICGKGFPVDAVRPVIERLLSHH